LTLIEFEQIYDEYINLTDNQADLEQELVSVQKLLNSIIFTTEEKEAIISGELIPYLQRLNIDDLHQINETQSKASESARKI
jgi:hypothetical protein